DPVFNYQRDLGPLQKFALWLSQLTGQADPNDVLWRVMTSIMAGLATGVLTFLASERLGNRWMRLGVSALAALVGGGIFYLATVDLGSTIQILGAIGLVVAAIAA